MQIGWFLSMFLVLETSWYKVQSSINTRLICFLFFFNLLSNCYSSMVDVVHRARLLSLLPICFLLSAIVLYVPVYFLKKKHLFFKLSPFDYLLFSTAKSARYQSSATKKMQGKVKRKTEYKRMESKIV